MGVDICVYVSPAEESGNGRAALIAIADDLLAQDLVLCGEQWPCVVFAGRIDPLDLSSPYAFANMAGDGKTLPDGLRRIYAGTDRAGLLAAARGVGQDDDLVIYFEGFDVENPVIDKMLYDHTGANGWLHLASCHKPVELTIMSGDSDGMDIASTVTRQHMFFFGGKGAIESFEGSPVQAILDKHLGPGQRVDISAM